MTATTPQPPGALGVAARPEQLLTYLSALDAWLTGRRSELDTLDQLISAGRADLTGDLALALALWQAVKNRNNLLLGVWDSGRVGPIELDRLSTLIWGSLDTGADSAAGSLTVSLPEAGRLCDALAAQLRAKLDTDPAADDQLARLRALRAGLERIRDQVALEPKAFRPQAQAALDRLAARTKEAAGKRERGGDIGGLLGPLEADAAHLERNLIVGAAKRREARSLLDQVREAHAQVVAQGRAVEALAAQAAAALWPPVTAAAPDVDELGPVPNTEAALRKHADQLAEVRAKLRAAQQTLSEPLAQLDRMSALLDALKVKADKRGAADDPLVTDTIALAEQLLATKPTVLPALEHVVGALSPLIDFAKEGRP